MASALASVGAVAGGSAIGGTLGKVIDIIRTFLGKVMDILRSIVIRLFELASSHPLAFTLLIVNLSILLV